MYRLYLIILLAFAVTGHAQLVSVGGDESLSLTNGSLFSIAGLELQPSSTFSLQNTQLSKQTNTSNTAGISNTSIVFVFSNNTSAYSGAIEVAYTNAALGSLTPDSLAISVYSASQWNRIVPSNVNTLSQKVSATVTALPLKEITLQVSSTLGSSTISTSSPSSSSSVSSGGSGGGAISSPTETSTTTTVSDTLGGESGLGGSDDDNDGYSTQDEEFCGTDPFDASSYPSDFDTDGIPDCLDDDDDEDGYLDILEIDCGYNSLNADEFPPDFDQDGLVDCIDPDDDNDGYLDENDDFPFDTTEWLDTDADGLGNNIDVDDDNDCFSDLVEVEEGTSPLDVFDYPTDIDRDCIPDRLDTDLNNDGIADTKLILPEIFSPNGDGINDRLEIINIENFPNNTVYIFSRSGLELVQIKNYNNSWGGTYRGKSVPAGSYLIAIDKEGDGTIDIKGWIYLIR